MALSLDQIKAVRTIVTHDNCGDGTGSALLLKDALPQAEVVFMQYGTEAYRNLQAQPGMMFCDIAPPVHSAEKFVEAGAIVLDHHKTARPVVEMFGANAVFADEDTEPGVSGTVLAYRHVWQPLREYTVDNDVAVWVERFTTLTGIRDTWQNRHDKWEDACHQAHLMHFMPNHSWLKYPLVELAHTWKDRYDWVARTLSNKHQQSVQKSINRGGCYTSNRGTTMLIMNSTAHTSDAAEFIDTSLDLIVGFGYEVENFEEKMIVSCRSHKRFDCSAFARRNGGGGHRKAAGFNIPVMREESPYAAILRLVNEYENTPTLV